MKGQRLTKTLSLDRDMAQAIERLAKKERRSFTRQVEIILENALKREKTDTEAEKSA
jgi:hypothetical protein